MPETSEEGTYGGNPSWRVRGTLFVWDRPLGKRDRERLGEGAPDGPILAARVADEGVKAALMADDPAVFFSIEHFNGYPAVLILLEQIEIGELTEIVQDAWLLRAPKRLATAYLAEHTGGSSV